MDGKSPLRSKLKKKQTVNLKLSVSHTYNAIMQVTETEGSLLIWG